MTLDTKFVWDIYRALGWAYVIVMAFRYRNAFFSSRLASATTGVRQVFDTLRLAFILMLAFTVGVLVWPLLLAFDVYRSIRGKR
ncbi:hypothetical protein [Leclercia adecarboxylata]|uniref:hypothetical protein n=1 Tax=Leclercia adecarboxylata TaxID=83655 RepID=UPI001117ADF6|nr:hypothetical protein [Leclercia adecarboxylata]QCZ30210.1 hypothetical protein FHN83_26970 [Leclercia adecarboxylata]QFH68123.1 hypothetical protein FR773_26200 [Leclercia adecarboxylata]